MDDRSFLNRAGKLVRKRHFFQALMGALLFGVIPPCVLTWIHWRGSPSSWSLFGPPYTIKGGWTFFDLFHLFVVGTIFGGPGIFLISALLLSHLYAFAEKHADRERHSILRGAIVGAFIAFLNIPCYLVGVLCEPDPLTWVRLVALFAFTGATCGAWLGWQAFRSIQPGRSFFPRFSLRTLVLLALGWGVLLALFMPD